MPHSASAGLVGFAEGDESHTSDWSFARPLALGVAFTRSLVVVVVALVVVVVVSVALNRALLLHSRSRRDRDDDGRRQATTIASSTVARMYALLRETRSASRGLRARDCRNEKKVVSLWENSRGIPWFPFFAP